ncbi:ethylbenzene dehydrogenase-related protein [uncultured Tateyamaria sp.]|uniref:ethylbenzene dehydrogenase-related protein n=1 Tax=uncultured Tateyamaria sp. TaxID=455651 RepID=UPI00261A9AEB|nr:ethylbenzene dehydrogenase-related protein [uncultured Tateyamaria sp.]
MPQRIFRKTDFSTVFLHWALVATLAISLLTGLRIAADAPGNTWARAVDSILLQGNVIVWHVWSAITLAFVMIAYVAFLIRARLQRRIKIDALAVASLVGTDKKRRWRAVNLVIYWISFALLAASTVTGLLLYALPNLFSYVNVLQIHLILAWSVLAYVVLHVIAQLAYGGLVHLFKIINPRLVYGSAALSAVAVASLAAVSITVIDGVTYPTLEVRKIDTAPKIDGLADDAAWEDAPRVEIATARGINAPDGNTVTARMVHDGETLYALFQWNDPTRSQKHLPLQKTDKGWKVLQFEFDVQDEDTYYEDKFGVMFAASSELAGAGTSHLGGQPIEGKPAPSGGRGLHYTTDGSIVDVWHWKSVRTGSFNQIDDNYFGPPMEVDPKKSRYTGGYTQDPKTGGGYAMNWEKFSTDIITPTHLPKDPALIEKYQNIPMAPKTTDTVAFAMQADDMQPYDPALDTYPVGTIMPSVIVNGPHEGDRGEVFADAVWNDGVWTLEAQRKMDTTSKYDFTLQPDVPVYMWVAVFDHTQTRHSQHLRPVELRMEATPADE